MAPVTVIILHVEPGPAAGPLERALAAARASSAETLRTTFAGLGADDVRLITGPPDELSFGQRLRELVAGLGRAGLVILGSGTAPLARPRDLFPFVDIARSGRRVALANNRYSADIVAIARARKLPAAPDLPADNALPRWLAERAGWQVGDMRRRWRLQIDLDSPLDVVLVGRAPGTPSAAVVDRLDALRRVLAEPGAEVVVTGRTSAASLRWLERRSACRIRAVVEERGLRASSPLAQAGTSDAGGPGSARQARSILGLLLDRTGPAALGSLLAELGDAAVVDTRVLLAHRLGADERRWPSADDRFASDLLLEKSVGDPWLRELTASAADAPIPILLGGHTLVGPGVRLLTPRGS